MVEHLSPNELGSIPYRHSVLPAAPGPMTPLYTFATLPPAVDHKGLLAVITDGPPSQNFGAAAAGGGSSVTPVYSDGVIWRNG